MSIAYLFVLKPIIESEEGSNFPTRVEFVGIDVSQDGNLPAISKHQLLWTWLPLTTVCDIASLIGFAIFYSNFSPHFEVCTKRLCETTKLVYSEPVALYLSDAANAEWEDIKSVMLSDHCMIHFDHMKHLHLQSDFSVISFGYAATQYGDDKESITAMHREMVGSLCKFVAEGSKLTLHPVAFGSQWTCSNETRLHLHLCQ